MFTTGADVIIIAVVQLFKTIEFTKTRVIRKAPDRPYMWLRS